MQLPKKRQKSFAPTQRKYLQYHISELKGSSNSWSKLHLLLSLYLLVSTLKHVDMLSLHIYMCVVQLQNVHPG